ncbi:MAG: sulfatase [Planctomycetes bacterium]|nr:sulfatase [Planctomycetota bacterium]
MNALLKIARLLKASFLQRRNTRPRLTASALLTLFAWCMGCAKPVPPNLVIVTIDTLRADHLGCFGYFRNTSPIIDKLAEESVFFTRCIAPMATTLPSHTSLFTATYPLEHGILSNLEFGGFCFVPSPKLLPLAVVAQNAGYDTAAFVSAAPLKHDTGLAVGFAAYDEPEEKERIAEKTNEAVFAWLDEHKKEPFLLWVHYYDPHYKYNPPAPYDTLFETDSGLETFLKDRSIPHAAFHELRGSQETREIHNRYDGEVRYTDTELGRLLDRLRAAGIWDRTVLLLIADHGEGLAQHYDLGHGAVWNEQLQIPLIIRAPGIAPQKVSQTLSLVDVTPTLLGLVPALPFQKLLDQASGQDVINEKYRSLPVFSQEVARDRPGREGPGYALTTDQWKYVYHPTSSDLLFHLPDDAFETRNVLHENDRTGEKFRKAILERISRQTKRGEQLRAGQSNEMIPMDPKLIEQLQQLGY